MVAALPLYDAGLKRLVPPAEVWGELAVGKDADSGTMVATLTQPHCSRYDNAALPPLYEPEIRLLSGGRLDLRGIERQGDAWHLQLWSCRVVSSLEEVMSHRAPVLTLSGLAALYQRQWEVLEAATTGNGPHTMDASRALELLGIPNEQLYALLEWAGRTNRCSMLHGGPGELGRICFKAPRLQGPAS